MARSRKFSTFSLSFLDIMSCGFGAVILIFLMIDHASNVHSETVNVELLSEVSLLDEEILEGREQMVRVRNTIASVDQQMVEAHGLSRRIIEDLEETRQELALFTKDTLSEREHINKLKAEIKSLEEEKKRLEAEDKKRDGEDVRQFIGEGERQYLTGLKLGGNRILVLLDASSSMLDHSIVNIIRRRNMSEQAQRGADKWQRAVQTVSWLISQFPLRSWYQIYTFNTDVNSLVPDTLGEWLEVKDREQLDQVDASLEQLVPRGGTSLENLFSTIAQLAPLPDNIILITDGLPTQGAKAPRSSTVSGRQRERFFDRAVKQLPRGIPVNVILTPLEGDPAAASLFWKLAIASGGSFLSPSRDWP